MPADELERQRCSHRVSEQHDRQTRMLRGNLAVQLIKIADTLAPSIAPGKPAELTLR